MTKNLWAGVSIAALGALAMSAAVAADRSKESKTLDLEGFDRIDISGVYELSVEVGGDYSITLSGPADELERTEASVRNGVLDLSQEEKKGRWGRNREGVEAVITLPALTGVEISGVVDGDIKNIDSDAFELEISGVGDIDVSGECGTLDAAVSGVGDLDAGELKCRNVDIAVSGVGDASVYASEEVEARVSGMGDIDVYGSPKRVTKSDSMFAEVTVH